MAVKKWLLPISIFFNIVLVVVCISISNYYKTYQKETYDLDTKYEKQIQNVHSNAEKVEITTEIGNRWDEKINTYYAVIIEHCNSVKDYDMLNVIEKSQAKWKDNAILQTDLYQEYLICVYGSGTIIPVKQSEFVYELNRSRALFLYHQCLDLYLVVEKP